MAVDVIMPQMGESIFEGTITKWLKKAGDKIEREEPLFEISTDKVDAEIPSPSGGVLKEIKVSEGQTVPIQTVVAIIEADGVGAQSAAPAAVKSHAAPSASSGDKSVAPANAPTIAQPAAKPEAKSAPSPDVAAQKPVVSASGEKVRSSPLVRRIARENDVDLTQVPGSGAGGRVSKRDILAAVEGGASSAAPPRTGPAPARPSAPPPAARGAAASALPRAAPAPASGPSAGCRGCLRFGRARKRRAARKNVLRPLRSPADVRDEAAHRRAHGALQASFSTW